MHNLNGFGFFLISKRTLHSLRTFFPCRQIVLRRAFNKLDKDGSGFLTRDEILDAASNEAELDASAANISDLLIHLVTDDDKKVDFPYCADKHEIYF